MLQKELYNEFILTSSTNTTKYPMKLVSGIDLKIDAFQTSSNVKLDISPFTTGNY